MAAQLLHIVSDGQLPDRDLFVFDQIVVELKAIRDISDVHFAIVRSYLRAVDRQDGLILNFGRVTLQPRRVEFSPKD